MTVGDCVEKGLAQSGEILLYNNGGEKEFVSVVFQDETLKGAKL